MKQRIHVREAVARQTRGRRRSGQALLVGALSLAVLAGCEQEAETRGLTEAEVDAVEQSGGELATDEAKASYSLGYRFAENVGRQFGSDIDNEAFVRGVRDQLGGSEALVDDAEAERVLMAMMESRQAAAAAESLANLERGHEFLEENAQREGVVTLESGLQYEVLESGEGESPEATDTVTTHYEGRLIDGTVFDSSYQRGEPASFPLDQVIPGWTEGLQQMSPGAKYRLYVPAELAYGERQAGGIPPNSTLIFDVELLEVDRAEGGSGEGAGGEAAQQAAEQ